MADDSVFPPSASPFPEPVAPPSPSVGSRAKSKRSLDPPVPEFPVAPTPVAPPEPDIEFDDPGGPSFMVVSPSEAAALVRKEGWAIFPLVPGEKRPVPGMSWTETSSNDPEVVEQVFAKWGKRYGGRCGVGLDTGKSGLVVVDVDGPISEELAAVLEQNPTLTWASATKGKPHHVYTASTNYDEQVGCPRMPGADVKGVRGLIARSDRPIIRDVKPVSLPKSLFNLCRKAAATSGGGDERLPWASVADLDAWLDEVAESRIEDPVAQQKLLDIKRGEFTDKVERGMARRSAALDVSLGMAIEAAAGLYSGRAAYETLLDDYRESREDPDARFRHRGTDPEKGWTPARAADYRMMWRGAVAKIVDHDYDDSIVEQRKRLFIDDGDSDLLGRSVSPVVTGDETGSFDGGGSKVADPAAALSSTDSTDTMQGVVWAVPRPPVAVSVAAPLPERVIPPRLWSLIEMISEEAGVDPRLAIGPFCATLSAALGGGVTVAVPRGGGVWWPETTALWALSVMGSGGRKSTMLRIMSRALRRAVKRAKASLVVAERSEREALALAEAVLKSAKTEADREMAELGVEAARARVTPLAEGFVITDASMEALEVSMGHHGGASFVCQDEAAGFLWSVLGLTGVGGSGTGSGKANVKTVTSAYGGEAVSVRRTGRADVELARSFVALALCTQPFVGVDVARNREALVGGFIPRLLVSRPPGRTKAGEGLGGFMVPDWAVEASVGASGGAGVRLADRLSALLELMCLRFFGRGWLGLGGELAVSPDPDAYTVLDGWFRVTEAAAAATAGGGGGTGEGTPMNGWWGRAHGHAARLAAVLGVAESLAAELADGSPGAGRGAGGMAGWFVGAEAMTAGVALARWFTSEMERFVDDWVRPIHGDPILKESVGNWLCAHRTWEQLRVGHAGVPWRITARDVLAGLGSGDKYRFGDMKTLGPVLDGLVSDGWLAEDRRWSRRADQRVLEVHPWLRVERSEWVMLVRRAEDEYGNG